MNRDYHQSKWLALRIGMGIGIGLLIFQLFGCQNQDLTDPICEPEIGEIGNHTSD